MPDEPKKPASDSAYNKYSEVERKNDDKNIVGPESANPPRYNGVMSPFYLYSTEEMALLERKSPITIRLEARQKRIGQKKDGRWYFSHEDRERLHQSFTSKKRVVSTDNISVLGNILERQDFLAKAVRELQADRQRSGFLLRDVHNEWMARFEVIQEWRNSVEKRLKELEGKKE